MRGFRICSAITNLVLLSVGLIVCLSVPWFSDSVPEGRNLGLQVFSLVTVFLLFLITSNEIISMYRISDSTHHTVLISVSLFLYSLGDSDMAFAFPIGGDGMMLFSEIWTGVFSLCAILSVMYFLTYTYRPYGKRISMIPILIMAGFCAILYASLAFLHLQIIGFSLFVVIVIGLYAYVDLSSIRSRIDDGTFYFSSAVLFSLLGMQLLSVLHYSGYIANISWWPSAYQWVCMVSFLLIYLRFILATSSRADRLQKQAERLRTNALLGQFKPHFVSNALTIIKSSYHKDMEEGDEALYLFSQYMRDSVGMLDEGLVSFERELEFLMHYVDFCNIGRENPINVRFDVDFMDFSVPSLSLQPYIENAVKYSKIDVKEGGRILISSSLNEGEVLVKISDNGEGFDVKQTKFGAGISNSRERFKVLMDAETEIESGENGTTVSIRIPKKQIDRGGDKEI